MRGQTDAIYREACALLAHNRVADAIDRLIDAVGDQPDEGVLWSLLGVAQWSAGQVGDSIASLETALTLAPLGAEGRLALALGYEVIQKRALATDLFVGLREEDDLPYRVLEPLARALARAEKPELALEVCQQAVLRRPDEVGPLRGVAFYLDRLGRGPEEAIPVLFKAFHLEPENFDTRMLLARRLHESGQTREAAYLLSVIDIESSSCPSCLNAMREIFASAGDHENAQRCVSTLVAIASERNHSEYPAG